MKILERIFIAAILVMLCLKIITPYIIENPQDISNMSVYDRSIMKSGLPPEGGLLLIGLILIILTCIGVLLFYLYRLDKALKRERDVCHLRNCWKMFYFLLFTGLILAVIQVALPIFALVKYNYNNFSYVLNSRIPFGITIIFILAYLFISYRKYTKAFKTNSLSDILAYKQKMVLSL